MPLVVTTGRCRILSLSTAESTVGTNVGGGVEDLEPLFLSTRQYQILSFFNLFNLNDYLYEPSKASRDFEDRDPLKRQIQESNT